MGSKSDQPSTSADPRMLQARDSIQTHLRQSFKAIRERDLVRAEERDQKRLRVEREVKEMEALAREHKEKQEVQREMSEAEHRERDREMKKKLCDASALEIGLGTSGFGSSSNSTFSSALPSGLMKWDKLSSTHARLSEYLSNIGKIKPSDPEEKKAKVEVVPILAAKTVKTPEISAKELERQKIKELLAQYLSEIDHKVKHNKSVEAPKKKTSKALKKASLFARLAAPTQSSLAKQTKKWNPKDVKEQDAKNTNNKAKTPTASTTNTSTSVATESKLACSQSKHVVGCVCERHSKRFPDFKP